MSVWREKSAITSILWLTACYIVNLVWNAWKHFLFIHVHVVTNMNVIHHIVYYCFIVSLIYCECNMGNLVSIHQVVLALYFLLIVLSYIIQFLIFHQSPYQTVTLISGNFQLDFHTACESFMYQDEIRG